MSGIVGEVTELVSLLKRSDEGQKRRNLKVAQKVYDKYKKKFAKDGIDDKEQEMLDQLWDAICNATK